MEARNARRYAGRYPRPRLFDVLDQRGIRYAWLADQGAGKRSYVFAVSAGARPPADPVFRARCAELLGLPESELFTTATPESNAADVPAA